MSANNFCSIFGHKNNSIEFKAESNLQQIFAEWKKETLNRFHVEHRILMSIEIAHSMRGHCKWNIYIYIFYSWIPRIMSSDKISYHFHLFSDKATFCAFFYAISWMLRPKFVCILPCSQTCACVRVCMKIVWLTFKIFSKICFLLFSRALA